MLVFYSGWGYWEYDCIAPFDGERMQNRVDRGPLQKVCCLFELPENGKKEFKYNGEATVSYLLECKRSDGEGIEFKDYYYQAAEDDVPRFVLCEEQVDENQPPIPRTVKFTKCIQENQIESLNDSDGVLDQPPISTQDVTKTKRKGPRPKQIALLLSVIDGLGNGRFNIPVGEKRKARDKCLENRAIFSSESVFDRVWSELSTSNQISIENKEKFL
ncbi:MAG: hypothetical protein ACXWF8_10715 [Methylobacter sp.]